MFRDFELAQACWLGKKIMFSIVAITGNIVLAVEIFRKFLNIVRFSKFSGKTSYYVITTATPENFQVVIFFNFTR